MIAELEFYATHSRFTDPGAFGALLETLPVEVPALCQALQGVIAHYMDSNLSFTKARLTLIDSRRVETILGKLEDAADAPLNLPRDPHNRFVGCCRDYATVFVAALRSRGIPARTRVGFAPYLRPGFNHDHVVAEYWNGARWVTVDPQLAPHSAPFDVQDMPAGAFLTASGVWRAWRRGEVDANLYGASPQPPLQGAWFIRNYVILELAALNKHETLLWDVWGVMDDQISDDLELIDRVADTMMRGHWNEVRTLYDDTPALQVPAEVMCYSPTGNTRLESVWR